MPEYTPVISSFIAGELSPYLFGMSHMPVYFQGCSLLKNFIPKKQGGFYKRPGTLVLGHSKSDTASVRIFPFVISQSIIYVLEFTNNLIRVWQDGVYMGATIPDIVTTYTAAELSDVQVYPFFPDLFITHRNHAPVRIRWASGTPNTLTKATLAYKTQTITFTGNTHTSVTVDGVTTNLLPAESIWLLTDTSGDIPANTYVTAIAQTAGSSPVTYTLTINNAATGTHAGDTFTLTLQPPPFPSVGNYPRCCAVIAQRLWFGNTINNPQELWQSIVGIWDASDPVGSAGIVGMAWSDISSYSVPILQLNADGSPTTTPATYIQTPQFQDQVDDADAGDYTIASDTIDEIYWLRNVQDILVGGSAGEWIVPATSNPNTMQANQISAVTDSPIPPTPVTGGIIFIQKLGKRVYKISWQSVYTPYIPPQDLTFFADHLFSSNPITAYDSQKTPDLLLWYQRTDGTVAVLLYDMTYGIQAWWQFVTTGTVLSVCAAPGTDIQGINDRDILYLMVQRGASVYFEQVATPYWSDNKKAVFSDCATYKYNAVKFTTMAVDTGLNGQILEVVADGAYIGIAVPAGGVLTLPAGVSANYAVAGLNFVSQMTSMPIVPQAPGGEGQLKKSALPKCRFRVYNSLYMRAGQFSTPNAAGVSGLSNVRMGDVGVNYQVANPVMYSGYCRTSILEALRDDCYLSVVSDLPLPLSVTAIVPDISEVESGR